MGRPQALRSLHELLEVLNEPGGRCTVDEVVVDDHRHGEAVALLAR